MNFFKNSKEDEIIYSNLDLIYSIFKTQNELLSAMNNYDYAEGELIDYYSYDIKATKSKLDFLLKKAKNRGIILDRIKQLELKFYEDDRKVV